MICLMTNIVVIYLVAYWCALNAECVYALEVSLLS